MSHLRKVDHVAYAVEHGAIKRWGWFHIEVEGGTLIKRVDDALPGDPNSSMKILYIAHGDFHIALVEGIDRAEKSPVTLFVEKHGDHACHHVAYDCHDLDAFVGRMKSMGGHPRGQAQVQNEGFGIFKQMFAKGYASGHAGETTFPEYCQRPRDLHEAKRMENAFSNRAAAGLYRQLQGAIAQGDTEPFFDFSHMPLDWEVPAEQPKGGGPAPLLTRN